MTPMKFILAILALSTFVCLATAKGKQSWGDECKMLSGILRVDETTMCNMDKGLVCNVGKCSCILGRVWDVGSCVVVAKGPCSGATTCVSNSKCEALQCKCNDGYYAKGAMCVGSEVGSGSSKISGVSGLAIFGMILSYILGN